MATFCWTEFDKERAIKAAKDFEEALLAAEPRRVKSELEKNYFFLKKKTFTKTFKMMKTILLSFVFAAILHVNMVIRYSTCRLIGSRII